VPRLEKQSCEEGCYLAWRLAFGLRMKSCRSQFETNRYVSSCRSVSLTLVAGWTCRSWRTSSSAPVSTYTSAWGRRQVLRVVIAIARVATRRLAHVATERRAESARRAITNAFGDLVDS